MGSKILDFLDSEYSSCINTLDSMRNVLNNSGIKELDTYLEQLKVVANPKYYPFTNKEVVETILQDGGYNIQQGFQKWIKDLEKNNIPTLSKIQNVTLGKNLATSKGDVIFENNIIEIIHYKPLCQDIYKQPLLIIPAWINKYYILDLNKNKSFVQYCLQKGIDVFIISWKSATPKDINLGLEDYIIQGIEKSISIINKPLHILGFCVGGVGSLIASIRNKNRRILSLSLLATPIDFSHFHQIKQFLTNSNFSLYIDAILSKGYQSGEDLFKMFCFLKSEGLIFKNIVDQYYLNKAPIENDILYWNMDSINIPAKLHLEYLEKFLLKNQLFENKYAIERKKIDINQLTLPTFVVATEKDHIVPPASAFSLRTNGNNVEYILGGSGHIAGIINPPKDNKYHFSSYCPKQQKLIKKDGSWWDTWSLWLTSKMNGKCSAELADSFNKIRPAPGKYVLNQINLNKHIDKF
jgi:polyhydroxyalkanoate synthase